MFKRLLILIFTTMCFALMQNTGANTIISVDITRDVYDAGTDSYSAETSRVYIKLFDELTPLTAANFLNYVDDGDYTNSFVHRYHNEPGLEVVQGGGFTFNPANGLFTAIFDSGLQTYSYPGGLQEVPKDDPVANEFAKSNTRGTLGMATLAGDTASATSQWFVNTADNSAVLDPQDFAVFAEVLPDSLALFDAIATTPVVNKNSIHGAFGELPLVNYSSGEVLENHLVKTSNFQREFKLTATFASHNVVGNTKTEPEEIDFGLILTGSTVTATLTITNQSTTDLYIGNMGNNIPLLLPFTIDSQTCASASPLTQNASCVLQITFSPSVDGAVSGEFNIEFTSGANVIDYTVSLNGEGSPVEPRSGITTDVTSLEFPETQLYDPATSPDEFKSIEVTNTGSIDLNIFSVNYVGSDAADFLLFNNCVGNPVEPGTSCFISVRLRPITIGGKSGEVSIVSDDIDNNVITILLTGSASLDNDGVLSAIEDMAPNNGDGNNDGVLDSIQSNVISVRTASNTFVTFVVLQNYRFLDFKQIEKSLLVSPPANIDADGAYEFKLNKILPITGNTIEVGLLFPAGRILKNLYVYGPTVDDLNPHWYEFPFDGQTGVNIFGDVDIKSAQGDSIRRSVAVLFIGDGGRGDSDLITNGSISILIAPEFAQAETSSGTISILYLLIFFTYALLRWRYLDRT